MDDSRPKLDGRSTGGVNGNGAAAAPSAGGPGRGRVQGARPVTLALQGGGAHGAFTWGVLDRLLEEPGLHIEGISGTSAGAMNGAVLASGLMRGGRDCARETLDRFWSRVGEEGRWSPLQPSWVDRMLGPGSLDFSPSYLAFDMLSRLFSPYQFNVLDYNPLRGVLEDLIDFEALRRCTDIKLFASATNVRTGKIKVFGLSDMSSDVILASACLPLLFRAVEVEGEHYWDGGFMGNPAIFPLLYDCEASDVVLVEVNPIRTARVPTTAREILDRMNNISFNSTLMREMRAVAFVSELVGEHVLGTHNNHRLRPINFHMIEAEETMDRLGASSKFNPDAAFLRSLKTLGRETAENWLEEAFPKVGVESSIDLQNLFF
jgi:NTE family protein